MTISANSVSFAQNITLKYKPAFPTAYQQVHTKPIIYAYFTLLDVTLLCFTNIAFLTNWRFMENLHWKSLLMLFSPTVFAHFMLLCKIFEDSCNISTFFIIIHICYSDLWSMIFVVTIVIGFGFSEPFPYKTADSINVVCLLTVPPTDCAPISLPLLGLPYSLRTS